MAADEKTSPRKTMGMPIQVDDDVAQGVYSNFAVINHNETEFVLDFVYAQPGPAKGRLRSRVIVSPKQARRFLAALQRNIELYEKKFGVIPAPKTPLVDDGSLVH